MATCRELVEEHSMKERVETSVENEDCCFVLEQLEEPMIDKDKEEMVEDLGDAESPWEYKVIENPSNEIEVGVKEESSHPPKHIPYEELDGIERKLSSLGIEDQASNLLGAKDKIDKQRVEFENSCEEMEVLRRRRMGYALSRSLEASLPKLSYIPSLEWVKLISISFVVPLEYGLLETDGQHRMICGIKRKKNI
ncbi:uncharacterized protein DS421_6g187950 [Arachis hypogaea]|nr:uncharacterized protein DS421_6g187950 [Arachis hypogaea]